MGSQPGSELRARLSVESLENRLAPATLTVTNANDAGLGSLRNAIVRANDSLGIDFISFAIGSGARTIRVKTALPAITDVVIIAGQTQPGYSGHPLVEVNGREAGAGVHGFDIRPGASGSVVRGLVINQFNGDAVRIQANNCRVLGNFIGTVPRGTSELSNGGNGVHILGTATGNIVGGVTAAGRNLISGNDSNGVLIFGSGAKGNVVLGNRIGTDVSGTGFIGNGVAGTPSTLDGAGVRIAGGASGNVVGGIVAGARNVISANTEVGVSIDGASGNRVQGNYIGTDRTGTAHLGNFTAGVQIAGGATGNLIGGSVASARNVISANGGSGVEISGTETAANFVRGNRIGLSAINGAVLGNAGAGVLITGDSSANTIGGTAAGMGNVVAHNVNGGVPIESGTGNALLANRIFNNGGPGIDLGHDGPTANDPGDTDTGANGLLNRPELSLARLNAAGLRITGSINSGQNKTLRIEFFLSAADPSGLGDGARYLGYLTVQTGETNTVNFTTVLAVPGLQAGQVVTATATDEERSTSEFSLGRSIV